MEQNISNLKVGLECLTNFSHANPIVEIDHLSYRDDSSSLTLDDISFVMEQVYLLGIIGPNGAGKDHSF